MLELTAVNLRTNLTCLCSSLSSISKPEAALYFGYVTSHPGLLSHSTLRGMVNEYQPKVGDALRLGR